MIICVKVAESQEEMGSGTGTENAKKANNLEYNLRLILVSVIFSDCYF